MKPYQPPGLWNELADADYVQDHGPNLYRRSLYTFWKRTVPPPSMVAFDAPGRETCIVRETRTNTPLQASTCSTTSPTSRRPAAFAERMMQRVRSDARGAARRGVPGRDGAAAAARGAGHPARRASTTSSARFRRDPRAAAALVDAGESTRDPRLDPCELAAYTAMAQLILNLDETITKE